MQTAISVPAQVLEPTIISQLVLGTVDPGQGRTKAVVWCKRTLSAVGFARVLIERVIEAVHEHESCSERVVQRDTDFRAEV